MRKLATIRTILDISPIDGADRIELVTIDGWSVIVKKGEYKRGDICVYIEIDSIVPKIPYFDFMESKKYRVKTIKMRGAISQGLVVPLSLLPEEYEVVVGDDVTDILGVKKYDPQAEKEIMDFPKGHKERNALLIAFMGFKWFRRLFGEWYYKKYEVVGLFPDWIRKTDEERIQNIPNILEHMHINKIKVYTTEKIDGCSATYAVKKVGRRYEFYVCSRNRHILYDDGSCYWRIANAKNIKNKMIETAKYYNLSSFVIQGEIIGPKIQGNKYDRDDYDFFVFNMLEDGKNISYSFFKLKIKSMDISDESYKQNLQCVPLIDFQYDPPQSVGEFVEYSKGKSALFNINREGVVVRSFVGGISFKVINPDFLLKEGLEE